MATVVALLGLLSFVTLAIGIIAVIKGNILSLGIKNRKVGAVVILASVILFVAMSGIDSSPSTKTDTAKDDPPPVVQTQNEDASETASIIIQEQAEQEYINHVVTSATEIGKALQKVGGLCQNYNFFDENWTLEIAVQMGMIQHYCNGVLEKQPPEKFEEPHDLYVRACSYYIMSMDSLATGIDNLDVAEIEKAISYMERGTEFINAASTEIQKLKE